MRKRPVIEQLCLVKNPPFFHKTQGSCTKISVNHMAIINPNRSLLIYVFGVKMRRRMIVVIHGNDDTEEACELWQLSSPEA